jgi:hypothetical protein
MGRNEDDIKDLKRRVKRIEDHLELSGHIVSFDWGSFSSRDKEILNALLLIGRKGATSTKIAAKLNMEDPETKGLIRIQRISRRIKGVSIIVCQNKKWSLNFDEFQFPEPEKPKE